MPDGTLRTPDALIAAGLVSEVERDAMARVAARYAIAVPPAFAALIGHADDPIGRQVLPHPAELLTAPHEHADPIGDEAHAPLPGVVHRYPDRVLIKPLLVCPLYCRFCFRREQVGPEGGLLSAAELDAAVAYVRAHPEIREVILTGGDPLMLSPRRLGALLRRLEAIPHVELLRIHTRVPVASPELVTDALADALVPRAPAEARDGSGDARVPAAPADARVPDAPAGARVPDAPAGARVPDALAAAKVSNTPAITGAQDTPANTRVPDAPAGARVPDKPPNTLAPNASASGGVSNTSAGMLAPIASAGPSGPGTPADTIPSDKPLWLVLHANHAREFSPAAAAAIRRIQSRGVPVLGQSVLLRGVNDSVAALEALFRTMLRHRIKPYYLHQLDAAPGTARFHVPIAEGRALLAGLRGRVTGLAWPTYVLDIEGGHGKVPIGPEYLDGEGQVRDPWGATHALAGPAASR